MTALHLHTSPTLRAIACSLAAALLLACSPTSPEKILSSARESLAKGDRATAIIELKNLLQKSPDNGEARLVLGQAHLEERDFDAAEKELRRALELKQPYEKVVPLLARALYELGKYDDLIAELQKRNLFDPSAVAVTQTILGDAYRQMRQPERANAAYAAALGAVPGFSRARLGQAIGMANEGKPEDALRLADDIIAADPKLAEAYAFKSDLMLLKGDLAAASSALEKAIAADAHFLPARFSFISLLIDEKAFDKAAGQLGDVRKIAPRDVRVNYYEGVLAFRKGDLEKGRDQVLQVLKVVPNHVPSLILIGTIELQLNQLASAESYLRRAVAAAPGHLGARRALVATQLRLGQPARAKETLQPLAERGFPNDPQLLLLAGETFLANGDVERATTLYQMAAAVNDTQKVAAKTRLGQIALATGRVDEGFRELEAASELDAGKYQADLALVTAHLRRKEFDLAMAAVQALEKKQPRNPLTFQMYGVVHLAKKDVTAARANFEKALEVQPGYLPAAQSLGLLDVFEKRPDDARKRYEAMIAKDPKNDQLYLALADLQLRTGSEANQVVATAQRAVEANPQSAPARLLLVNLYLRGKEGKLALAAAQSAIAVLPNDPRIIDVLGSAQESAGEINQAVETYTRLAKLSPQAPQPLYRLAAMYVRQKETDKAVEVLRRVQKLVPNAREVVPQIVQTYMAADRTDDAIKEVRNLQKREPKFVGGWSLEGDILASKSRFDDAERLYRKALQIEPRANAVAVRLHQVLAAAGKNADADAFAKKWIAENPKDAAMHRYLGDRNLAAKSYKAAAVHYRAVVALEPENSTVLNSLAWTLGELGDPQALEFAERAVKLAPNSAAALDTLGALLVKRGDAKRGVEYLERATKLAPGRPEGRLNYAKGLLKTGNKAAAKKELESLQSVKEDFPGKSEVAELLKGI